MKVAFEEPGGDDGLLVWTVVDLLEAGPHAAPERLVGRGLRGGGADREPFETAREAARLPPDVPDP